MKFENIEIYETDCLYNFKTNKLEKAKGIVLIKNNKRYFLDLKKQEWKELKISKKERELIKKLGILYCSSL